MINRRNFIKQVALGSMAMNAISSIAHSKIDFSGSDFSKKNYESKLIWANLLHLSTNMWEDHSHIKRHTSWPDILEDEIHWDDYPCKTCKDSLAWGMRGYRSFLVFEEIVWNRILQQMAHVGMNMVIIDLGDGIKYESHPEIAVKNAWSVDKLRTELKKIQKLGLEPIPKLNFATSHDTWMGEYAKMVSTSTYYSVCRDLINEVIEIFDTPRFFHLGMDEETANDQRTYNHVVVRQNDLWWNDLYFYINEVEKKGVRSWIWSDYGWRHPDLFFKKMPKSVLQSNWYYGSQFDMSQLNESNRVYLKFYEDLDAHGYDQVPTGSNCSNDTNMEDTVNYCKKYINPDRLLGFMTAPWFPTVETCLQKQTDAVDQISRAIKNHK